LTIVIAIGLGFAQALLAGVICYLFVFFAFVKYGAINIMSQQ